MSGEKSKKKGKKVAEAVEAVPVVSERVAANRRWREHLRTMRMCWGEWDGPKVCDGIDGLCEVGETCVWNETNGCVQYHYMELCRVIEIGPRFAWVRVVNIEDEEDPDVLRLDWSAVWPPTKELWKLRDAAKAEEQGEFLDQVNKEQENDMSEVKNTDGPVTVKGDGVDVVDGVDGVVEVNEGYAVRMVPLVQLRGHPLNRSFEQAGPKWEAFVASIGEHGVMMPLVVRPLGDGYQILAGHRRFTASKAVVGDLWEVAQVAVPCVVRELNDAEAVEFLCIENLERENPDPVEEAELVCAMLGLPEYEGDAEHLADRLKRSVDWVVTRQGLLQLGDEVISALRKPADDPGHIGVRVAEELLKVPVAERERAVQLVLHPDWGVGALRPREAAAEIRERILEPMRKRAEWEKAAPKLVKAWRKELKGILTKDEFSQLILQAAGWREIEDGMVARRSATDLFYAYDAGGERTWAALAVRNGMPLWIVPGGDDEVLKSAVVVDERLLRMAELAREENGVECWLRTKPLTQAKPAGSDESSVISDQKETVESEDDEWEPKSEAPPEERHVRREAGRTMLVSKDRLERAVELVRLASYDRDLTDDEQLDLPNAVKVNEIGLEAAESVLGYLGWVLEGCPILGAEKGV